MLSRGVAQMNNRFSKPTADTTKNTPAAVVSITSNFVSGLAIGMIPVSIASFFASMSMPAMLALVGTKIVGATVAAAVGATAVIAVGATLIVGLPMLVIGGIAGVIAYRKHKKDNEIIQGLQTDYNDIYDEVTSLQIDKYIKNAREILNYIEDNKTNLGKSVASPESHKEKKDAFLNKLLYVLTMISIFKRLGSTDPKIQIAKKEMDSLVAAYIIFFKDHLETENKKLMKELDDSYRIGKLKYKDVFDKTNIILSNYDKISKINFASQDTKDTKALSDLPEYQIMLKNNNRAAIALNKNSKLNKVKKHEPWGADRSSYFSTIRADYNSAGLGSAFKTFGTKTYNRASAFIGGFGLVIGISATVIGIFSIPVTWPVLLVCGLVAAAVGAVSVYATYKLDRDQNTKRAGLERRNEIAKSMQVTHKMLEAERNAKEKTQTAVNSATAPLVSKTVTLQNENADLKNEIADLKRQLAATTQQATTKVDVETLTPAPHPVAKSFEDIFPPKLLAISSQPSQLTTVKRENEQTEQSMSSTTPASKKS